MLGEVYGGGSGDQDRCLEEVTFKWGLAAWVGVRPAKERGSGLRPGGGMWVLLLGCRVGRADGREGQLASYPDHHLKGTRTPQKIHLIGKM